MSSGTGARVLVVPASYFAADRTVGGGERYAFEYARALSELTPTTLALFDTTPGTERIGSLEVRTFPVRHSNERGFPWTTRCWRELGEYDVVHGMVFPTPLMDLLALSTRLRRQTFVLTDVGGGGPCWSTYLQKVHPRASLNRLADGLAPLSRHAAGFFSTWKQPRTILYGGVDREKFAPDGTRGGYALFVGRLLPHKGVLPLIRALAPEIELRVVGRPYDEGYVRELHAAAEGKRVRFIFDADDAELRREYAGASVVLQPSLPTGAADRDTSELLGLVTLEAMASGRPVIVTRSGSLPELVVDGETGFVVAPHDLAALGERVRLLVENEPLSLKMGAAARRHVEENFTWERAARRGRELYDALDSRRRG